MGAISVWHILILLVLFAIMAGIGGFTYLVVKSGSTPQPRLQPPGAIAPGWYPDNANPAILRWFDGHQWTAQTQPRQ
ncbi:DUF2510 domain-containing protein [Nocardia sp. NPDC046473]|uniref:DUF2510 domain-containing protein n=1 Tax=Nocardia sp. NPDC046473 TaxID=3155733 RepID=UPI0033D5418C